MPETSTLLRKVLGRHLSTRLTQHPARLLARIAYRLRGWLGVPYRAAYFFGVRLASANSRSAPLSIALSGDMAHDVQLALAAPPAPQARRHLEVAAGAHPVSGVLSALLMSDEICDIDVVFSDPPVPGARAPDAHLSAEAWARLRRGLSHPAFEHGVNRYLKVAHPGAFVVAVSLPVAEDGFCDRHFEAWRAALGELARTSPALTLVLLNPIGPELCRTRFVGQHGPVFSAALAGLSLAERVCLAQRVDAFLGVLDLYGLAARAAERPGVYLDGIADTADAAKRIAHRTQAEPREAARLFGELLANLPGAR